MDKKLLGGGLMIGIVFGVIFGIIFGNLALGICFGLIFGGFGGKLKADRDKPKSLRDNGPKSLD